MDLSEIIQTIYGFALAVVLLVYGNKLLNSMVPPDPKEKK